MKVQFLASQLDQGVKWRKSCLDNFGKLPRFKRTLVYVCALPSIAVLGSIASKTLPFGALVAFLFGYVGTDILTVLAGNFLNGKLKKPPGYWCASIANLILSKRFNNRVLNPAITDMREEYFEALSENRIWKARWVRVRGTYSFFAALGLDRAFAFVSSFVKAWKSVN